MNSFWENLSDNSLDRISPVKYKNNKNIIKKAKIKSQQHIPLRILIIAASMIIIVSVCYATYDYWKLPPPEIIDDLPPVVELPDSESNISELPDSQNNEQNGADNDSDFNYPAAASEILKKLNIDTSDITPQMSTEYATRYNREQMRVSFGDISITFDSKDIIPISGQLPKKSSGSNPISEQEALSLAQELYDKLPFPKGYVYSSVNRIDDEYGIFSFTRGYNIITDSGTVYIENPYEEIRITVNFMSGTVESWNSFYFPLLDDHKPEDTPISEQQAIQIASDKIENIDGCTVSANIGITLPNYMFTEYFENIAQGENYVYPSVTRIVWQIEFNRSQQSFTDKTKIYVDYYTGEILGGDQAK